MKYSKEFEKWYNNPSVNYDSPMSAWEACEKELLPIIEKYNDYIKQFEQQVAMYEEALAINKEAQGVYVAAAEEINKLEKQNAKYREALERYANPKIWENVLVGEHDACGFIIALEALKDEK
jgi:tetratricopeptide (TPR) repeat protein